MRKLTEVEKKVVKNLQVSNSIYKSDIKKIVTELQDLNPKLEALKAQEPTLLGEAHAAVQLEISKLEATIGAKIGKIKYIEGRMVEKEAAIEAIQTQASREEETVVESHNPNDPEVLAKKEEERAKREAEKQARSTSRNKRKAKEGQSSAEPTTQEF